MRAEMARTDQGSCRRCHRDLPGCSRGACGGHPRRSARLHGARDPVGADRISALHDDLLLQILNRLGCAAAAARTGVLSRRWRGLWTRLPELVIREMTQGSLLAALARLVAAFEFDPRARPQLLDVHARWYCRFSLAQIGSLFDAAARLQPENLAVEDIEPFPVVMLPRLDGTRSITLDVRGVSLTTPEEGDMPELESLSFRPYDAVLASQLDHCSALRSLSISNMHLDSITIHLPLLEELVLSATTRLRQVVIVAPRLKKLAFKATSGFADDFTLLCLAPEVEDLSWEITSYLSPCFGDIWSLTMVTIETPEPQGQLQQSPPSNTLSLSIWESRVFVQEGAAPSFEHYIYSLFPIANISALELCINSCGHAYGAMVLHLLQVYTSIKRLRLDIHKFQARRECSANCLCVQLNNWRKTVSLTHLNEMEMKGVRAEDHEIDILKVILRSAAMLERVTITFKTKSKQHIHGFSSKIQRILKAHPSVKCGIYHCSGEQVLSA